MNCPLLLNITSTKKLSYPVPPLITHYILGKKVALIAFRLVLPKILLEACIFSYTIMTYLKKLVGTKSLNTSQRPTGLSLFNIYWKLWRWGKNPTQQSKIYLFPPAKKSSLTHFHLQLSKVSFLPPSNNSFHLITLYKLHL